MDTTRSILDNSIKIKTYQSSLKGIYKKERSKISETINRMPTKGKRASIPTENPIYEEKKKKASRDVIANFLE